jgi:hypothetical protein
MLAGYSDVLDRGTQTLRSVLAATLERGVREGDVRTDVDLQHMADLITEVCVRFGDRLLSGDLNDRGPHLLDAIIETVLFGVIARRPVAAQA